MNLVHLFRHVGLGLPALLLVGCTGPDGQTAAPAGSIAVARDGIDRDDHGVGLTGVASAVTKSAGVTAPNALSPELIAVVAAQGAIPVENPMVLPVGDPAVSITHYGYDGDGPLLPAPGDAQTATHQVEATKTEPDKNTYLVLSHQAGADLDYDYGTHFMFQGHENGARAAGAITRINLDADAAHRVTVMAVADTSGQQLLPIDGSTWDPFAQRLLFTVEAGPLGRVYQATLDVPSAVEDLAGSFGRGGYEEGGAPGFHNEGDNEITGFHISDGDPTLRGLLGARLPQPFHRGWRVFFTQQHGDNTTWELLPRPTSDRDDD